MEIAYWLESYTGCLCNDAQRIYLGHETRIDKIPALGDIIETSHRLRDVNQSMTLVTPAFLTESEAGRVCKLVEAISDITGGLEVVCNDWGLLHWLTEHSIVEPIIGRLLAGQATDPRLAAFDLPGRQLPFERYVRHADGTTVRLSYRQPVAALMTHLQSCALATPEVLSFFLQLGIQRFEVSNVLQGIEMVLGPEWRVTLHLPEVPVAIARQNLSESENQWLHPTFPVALRQCDNMIVYRNCDKPQNMGSLRVDRLVYQMPR